MGGHPTVTVVPALLALGEQIKASGRLFIESFVAGYETSGRVGRLVSPSHYQKGFHVTGTVGSFSATAAAGRMLGLTDEQLAVAFGIAATQAAGLKSNFGTMCKPLHAGTASEHGLRAARLAAKGFTARGNSLECDQGFASSQSDHLEDRCGARRAAAGLAPAQQPLQAPCRLLPHPFADRVRQGDPAEEQLPAGAGEEDHAQDRRRRRQGLQHPATRRPGWRPSSRCARPWRWR